MLGDWPHLWRSFVYLVLAFSLLVGAYWYAAHKAGQLIRCEREVETLLDQTIMGALEGAKE